MDDPKTMEEKVDAILRILQGEPYDKNDKGLLGTVRWLKTEITDIKRWKDKTIAWVVGFSFGGGALMTFILDKILNRK